MNMSYPTLGNGFPGIVTSEITIGIELELVLCGLPRGMDTQHEYHRGRGANTTFELIRRALAPVEQSFEPPPVGKKALVFDVQSDDSIDTSGIGHRGGVEVATPILTNESWTWVVPRMCEAIIKGCADIGARVEVNESTGFHIHVGIGRNYTIDELKRVGKAIVIFERAMDTYHPAHRDGTPPADGSISYINSCRKSPSISWMTAAQMVQKISGVTNYAEFRGALNGAPDPDSHWVEHQSSRNFKYNFDAVRKYGTIEFRQAAGTIDPVWIVKWIECVIKFITCAIETPDETYTKWARLHQGPMEVLEMFGLPMPESEILNDEKLGLDGGDDSDPDYEPRKRKRDAFMRVGWMMGDALRAIRQPQERGGGEGFQGER